MRTNFWLSDQVLQFGPTAKVGRANVRSEYIYLGRTTSGTLNIRSISLQGDTRNLFKIDQTGQKTVGQGGHLRIRVTFSSNRLKRIPDAYEAKVVINYTAGSGVKKATVNLKSI